MANAGSDFGFLAELERQRFDGLIPAAVESPPLQSAGTHRTEHDQMFLQNANSIHQLYIYIYIYVFVAPTRTKRGFKLAKSGFRAREVVPRTDVAQAKTTRTKGSAPNLQQGERIHSPAAQENPPNQPGSWRSRKPQNHPENHQKGKATQYPSKGGTIANRDSYHRNQSTRQRGMCQNGSHKWSCLFWFFPLNTNKRRHTHTPKAPLLMTSMGTLTLAALRPRAGHKAEAESASPSRPTRRRPKNVSKPETGGLWRASL